MENNNYHDEQEASQGRARADSIEKLRNSRKRYRYHMRDDEHLEELLAAEAESLDTYFQHLRTVRNPKTKAALERMIRQKIALEEQLVRLSRQGSGVGEAWDEKMSLGPNIRDILLGAGLALLATSLLPQLRETLQHAALGITGGAAAGSAASAQNEASAGAAMMGNKDFQQLKDQLAAELKSNDSGKRQR